MLHIPQMASPRLEGHWPACFPTIAALTACDWLKTTWSWKSAVGRAGIGAKQKGDWPSKTRTGNPWRSWWCYCMVSVCSSALRHVARRNRQLNHASWYSWKTDPLQPPKHFTNRLYNLRLRNSFISHVQRFFRCLQHNKYEKTCCSFKFISDITINWFTIAIYLESSQDFSAFFFN